MNMRSMSKRHIRAKSLLKLKRKQELTLLFNIFNLLYYISVYVNLNISLIYKQFESKSPISRMA